MNREKKFQTPEENFQFERKTDEKTEEVVTGLWKDIFISLRENDAGDICSIPEELQEENRWYEEGFFPPENYK